jgi:hypothetical protein
MCADARDQIFHVGLAARVFLCVESPVPHIRLPSIIDHCPTQSELPHLGQRLLDEFTRTIPLVAPRTPDGLIRSLGRTRRRQSARTHHAAVEVQHAEVVTAVRRYQRLRCLKGLPRLQRAPERRCHGHNDAAVAVLDRQRHYLWRGFDVSDRKTRFASPDIDDRGSAAIVRGIHAHEIVL